MRTKYLCHYSLSLLLWSAAVSGGEPSAWTVKGGAGATPKENVVCSDDNVQQLQKKMGLVREASLTFRKLALAEPPEGLGKDDADAAYDYVVWLRAGSEQLDELGREGLRLIRYCKNFQWAGKQALPLGQVREMERSFNQQRQKLQKRLEHEHGRFASIVASMQEQLQRAQAAIESLTLR